MNILIIEDEPLAAERLQILLSEQNQTINVIKVIDSVKASVNYFNNYPEPDLIFMDIMLADGQSFEIFEHVEINVPIIFTTAYDEFAIQAFKVYSIDYLLKPLDPQLLNQSLKKLKAIRQDQDQLKKLLQSTFFKEGPGYKSRFLVKSGETHTPVAVSEIAYFAFEDKVAFLYTITGKRYMLDYSLDELEKMVDPKLFFRLNRQYLSSFPAIKTVHNYFNSKLKVHLLPHVAEDILVSKEKAAGLRAWLNM